jgi:hypothetical protein
MEDHEYMRFTQSCARRHFRFGWWALLCFLVLGIALEGFHALKTGWYLNVDHQTRRLMWTLAHAHGTLIAVLNIVFGASLALLSIPNPRTVTFASRCLMGANVLLPAGFFLGGVFSVAGDPGAGIVLVPIGAALLLAGVFQVARATLRATPAEPPEDGHESLAGKARTKSRRR